MDVKAIETEEDLTAAFQRLEQIFQADDGTPEASEMEALVIQIEAFESKCYPIALKGQSKTSEARRLVPRVTRCPNDPEQLCMQHTQ